MAAPTGQRILVVDDDASIRSVLQIALGKAGYEVVPARNGSEAIHLWLQHRTDLVITDLHMPERNGLEVLLKLRAQSPDARIILMSDGGQTQQIELLEEGRLLGAVQSIKKPFLLAEMLSLVSRTLGEAQ